MPVPRRPAGSDAAPSDTVVAITARLDELFEDLDDTGSQRIALLESFLRRIALDMDLLDGAAADDDGDVLHTRAHSIKGMAGNIGAGVVAEAAGVVEDAARDGRLEQVPAALANLHRGVDDAVGHIRDMLAASGPPR